MKRCNLATIDMFDQLTGKNFSFGNTIMHWVEAGTKTAIPAGCCLH